MALKLKRRKKKLSTMMVKNYRKVKKILTLMSPAKEVFKKQSTRPIDVALLTSKVAVFE